MARIVKVEADMVSIGMPDGSLVTVPRSEIPFSVKEGMAVEAYRDETGHVLVTRGSSKRVSKIIYILLAVFLGNFGIHRFYAGHTVAGICYLVATGIGALLAFIGIGLIWKASYGSSACTTPSRRLSKQATPKAGLRFERRRKTDSGMKNKRGGK